MYALFESKETGLTEAVVLAASKDRMRLAVPGCADVVELKRSYTDWYLESGEMVVWNFLSPAGDVVPLPEEAPLTRTAGSPIA